MGSLRSRLVTAAGVSALACFSATTPANAAGVGQVPSASWGVYKSCGSGGGNCASVYAIVSAGGKVFLGGSFTALVNPATGEKRSANNVAALSTSGTPAWTGNVSGTVHALATNGSRVYAGGSGVVALSASTGARVGGFSVSGRVHALRYGNSRLYVGGSSAKAVDPGSGRTLPGFKVSLKVGSGGTAVNAFALVGSRLYIAGRFDSVDGHAQRSLAAVDAGSGGFVSAFTPSLDVKPGDRLQAGLDVDATSDGVVLAQGGHLNRAYRFSPSGKRMWSVAPDGDVQAVTISGGSVYIGGHFLCVGNCYTSKPDVHRTHIAALSYSGGKVDSWAPQMLPTFSPYFFGVWSLETVGGSVWAGGVFINVRAAGKTYDRPKVAVFR